MNAMIPLRTMPCLRALGLAIALSIGAVPTFAQEMDHSKMQMPPAMTAAPTKKPATKKPGPKPAATKKKVTDPHAGHAMPPPKKVTPASSPQPAAVDHAAMGHAMPMSAQAQKVELVDHAAMGHDMPAPQEPVQPVDHAAMGHDMPAPAQADQTRPMNHSAMGHDMPMPKESAQLMDHSAMEGMTMAPTEPITPIPALTDVDRAAAAPPSAGHAAHDETIHSFWLLDRLEGWNAEEGTGIGWEALSWIGTDLDRVWLRSEGERVDGAIESADIEVLYGRSVTRWWDVVAGVRHDFGEGPSQTFAAIGMQGLAPQKFEVEATAYIGQSGQSSARLEAEYDTLLTNRLILQWRAEVELYGKVDQRRGIGSGLSTIEAGVRLRYEITRKFAPYVGVVRERAFGSTADFREADGEDIDDTRVVAGLRVWF